MLDFFFFNWQMRKEINECEVRVTSTLKSQFSRVQFRAFFSSFFGYLQAQPLLNLHYATSDLQITPPFLFILLLTLTSSISLSWFTPTVVSAFSSLHFFRLLFLHFFSLSPCVLLLALHSRVFWSTDSSLRVTH